MVDYVDGVVTRDSGPDGEAMPFLAMGDPCANEEALMQPPQRVHLPLDVRALARLDRGEGLLDRRQVDLLDQLGHAA